LRACDKGFGLDFGFGSNLTEVTHEWVARMAGERVLEWIRLIFNLLQSSGGQKGVKAAGNSILIWILLIAAL